MTLMGAPRFPSIVLFIIYNGWWRTRDYVTASTERSCVGDSFCDHVWPRHTRRLMEMFRPWLSPLEHLRPHPKVPKLCVLITVENIEVS